MNEVKLNEARALMVGPADGLAEFLEAPKGSMNDEDVRQAV